MKRKEEEMIQDFKIEKEKFEAKIDKLRNSGYSKNFMDLSEGVTDYYQNHLSQEDIYL